MWLINCISGLNLSYSSLCKKNYVSGYFFTVLYILVFTLFYVGSTHVSADSHNLDPAFAPTNFSPVDVAAVSRPDYDMCVLPWDFRFFLLKEKKRVRVPANGLCCGLQGLSWWRWCASTACTCSWDVLTSWPGQFEETIQQDLRGFENGSVKISWIVGRYGIRFTQLVSFSGKQMTHHTKL